MLKQNTLAEATTELGFATETNTPLTRKITIDGQECIVEGITADKMKEVLNQNGIGTTTFKTPGEQYRNNDLVLNGVVQNYNGDTPEPGESGYNKTKDIFIPGKVEPVGYARITASKEAMEAGQGTFDFFMTNTSMTAIGNYLYDLQPGDIIESSFSTDSLTEENLDANLESFSGNFIMLTENPISLARDLIFDNETYGNVTTSARGYELTVGYGDIGFGVNNNSDSYLKLWYGDIEVLLEPYSGYSFIIHFDEGELNEQALKDKLDEVYDAVTLKEGPPPEEQI